ncbi:nuclear transport factor 2 family protein [Congregibacter sp.]|uniref:nuclear transport factor 2 family protein n=1 Tax=Congregibacter sp. TaxID=2744308 RepID=UPI003F6C35A0
MFRQIGLSLVMLLILGSVSVTADDRSEIAALLDEFLAGASVNDVAMHERFWADDLVYTSSSGARYGKQTILDGMSEAPASDEAPAVYTSDQVNIRILGRDIAVVTFRLVSTSEDGTVDYYLNSGVFERADSEWRASTWQATHAAQ